MFTISGHVVQPGLANGINVGTPRFVLEPATLSLNELSTYSREVLGLGVLLLLRKHDHHFRDQAMAADVAA
jgi:hypothetical protein